MHVPERLYQAKAIQQCAGGRAPIGGIEEDIAVEPGHFAAFGRKFLQSQIQQPLLLPEHGASLHPDQDVSVRFVKFEIRAVGQLNRDERDVQARAKGLEVRKPARKARRVEVRSDRPEIVGSCANP